MVFFPGSNVGGGFGALLPFQVAPSMPTPTVKSDSSWWESQWGTIKEVGSDFFSRGLDVAQELTKGALEAVSKAPMWAEQQLRQRVLEDDLNNPVRGNDVRREPTAEFNITTPQIVMLAGVGAVLVFALVKR